MKTRTQIIIITLTILLVALTFSFIQYNLEQKKINCNNLGVIYLKQSELQKGIEIRNKNPNTITVFPELNKVVANSKVLECPNFDYSEYIK